MDVRGDEADGQPLLLEELGQLPGGRRLALTVQPDEEDPLLLNRHLAAGTQDLHQLLVDDSDDMLARAHARGRLLFERPPLELLRNREGELDVHVRLDERPLDVPDDLFDERLIDVTGARDLAERLS